MASIAFEDYAQRTSNCSKQIIIWAAYYSNTSKKSTISTQ